MNEPLGPEDTLRPAPEVIERLVASHRRFLAFLEPRVQNRAVAEELLQSAFVLTLEKGNAIRESESAVAWFYRVLRNALTDFYRRQATESRALEAQTHLTEALPPATELQGAICDCMYTLLPTLKPEYAQMIRRVDLEDQPIAVIACDLGVSVNNATVRLHRARQALKRQLERSCGTCAEHGCLECSCGSGQCQ